MRAFFLNLVTFERLPHLIEYFLPGDGGSPGRAESWAQEQEQRKLPKVHQQAHEQQAQQQQLQQLMALQQQQQVPPPQQQLQQQHGCSTGPAAEDNDTGSTVSNVTRSSMTAFTDTDTGITRSARSTVSFRSTSSVSFAKRAAGSTGSSSTGSSVAAGADVEAGVCMLEMHQTPPQDKLFK